MTYVNGILGLQDGNPNTLVARVGNKFSYCIGNISDSRYVYNQLILGDGAIIQGDSRPFQVYKGLHYAMKLEGISVGDKQLEIDQKDFDFNVVLDSGSTRSHLRRSAFEPLKKEVQNLMDGLLWRRPRLDGRLCYLGNLVRDLKGFPTVTLHLAGGADLYLDVEGMFRRLNDYTFCMAVEDSGEDGHNIIGVFAQQYYNFGFDLNAREISFQRIDCELLDD